MSRRHALGLLAGVGVAALAACAKDPSNGTNATSSTSSGSAAGSTTSTSGGSEITEIPDETGGPYPGDGSNGPNVLTESGIVRSDIRSSFGSASGTVQGVPLTLKLKVLDAAKGTAVSGAAVYVWHCNRDGEYSMYTGSAANENYLRGVQQTGSDGTVTFTSIFPGAYPGRWPHVHIEVHPSLSEATSAATPAKTTQLAFPEHACKAVYAADGYDQSLQNLAQTSLSSDMVFGDGWDTELATVTGSVANGYSAQLDVGV